MANRVKTEARLARIFDRQWVDHWGRDYVPSVWATPQEAPGWTWASVMRPAKLGGREFHTFGKAEEFAAYLALHNNRLWDLHEGRMLFPGPRAHFLHGHPRAAGVDLRPIAGTVAVADRMGILPKHPTILVSSGSGTSAPMVVPFPYIGDLLLYLEDEEGAYALNWNVTDKGDDYFPRGMKHTRKVEVQGGDERISKVIEKAYYDDAGIRTQNVAGRSIDFDLRCNLRELFLHQKEAVQLPPEQTIEITSMFRAAIGSGVVAYEVAAEVAAKAKIGERLAILILKQGIWNRDLRIDLFRPFLMDKPLHSEVCDVFDRYGNWFRR